MNSDTLLGRWKLLQGAVRFKWAVLKNDADGRLAGLEQMLAARLQTAYGVGRQKARRQVPHGQATVAEPAAAHAAARWSPGASQ